MSAFLFNKGENMLAVIDCRLPEKCRESLAARGFEPLPLPPFKKLSAPVASHPDMLLFISDGILITHKDYYEVAKAEIDRIASAGKLNILLSDEEIGDTYPHDIIFNAALVGNSVLCLEKAISKHIKVLADETGRRTVNVNQGYTKCSTVIVDKNAVITSDRTVALAARECGIDLLFVRPGYIELPGYDTGFIGGASGRLGDKIYFCGDLDTHPDAMAIKAFCAAHCRTAVSLSDDRLFDAGTIFFI